MSLESLKEQWEGLPEWQRILVVALVTALIMYGLYALVIDPKKIEKEQLSAEVKNLEIQVDRLKRFARPEIRKKLEDRLASIKEEIKSLNKQLEDIKSVVPTEEKTQDVLRFIASSAIVSNVSLNQFRVSPPEEIYLRYNRTKDTLEVVTDKKVKKDKSFIKLNRITINLDMKSRNLGDLVSFIRRLGKSDRFFRMDRLIIEKVSDKKKSKGYFSIKVVISTYFM